MKTEVIKADNNIPDKNVVKEAAKIIKKGGLVAFPTETVYGLAADYLNGKAMDKLFKVKNRPKDKPFTIHISDYDVIGALSCEISIFEEHLIQKFWPGPLTLILRSENGGTTGFRMPKNRLALDFISACKTPIVAPSANISGNRAPRTANEVLRDLDGKIDMLLDGGKTEVGTESTVVDVSAFPYKILREGAINKTQIADIGRKLQQIHS